MPDLDAWFVFRDTLRQIYREELGRDVIGDPDALTNWFYHWREGRQSDEWIRDRIRESPEWQARHDT